MEWWCEKKGKYVTDKKARKKCIERNIEKRGMRCVHLMTEEDAILYSVKMNREGVRYDAGRVEEVGVCASTMSNLQTLQKARNLSAFNPRSATRFGRA